MRLLVLYPGHMVQPLVDEAVLRAGQTGNSKKKEDPAETAATFIKLDPPRTHEPQNLRILWPGPGPYEHTPVYEWKYALVRDAEHARR
ncbi:MAG: hypothetical protein ACYDC6_04790 [Acidobacteriaceae bacterium]